MTPGALVTANQAAALATVQQLDPIYVDLTQSSAELLRLRATSQSGKLQRASGSAVPVQLRAGGRQRLRSRGQAGSSPT